MHTLGALVGYEAMKYMYDNFEASGQQFAYSDLMYLGNAYDNFKRKLSSHPAAPFINCSRLKIQAPDKDQKLPQRLLGANRDVPSRRKLPDSYQWFYVAVCKFVSQNDDVEYLEFQ